jgi:hypothetical protein
MVFVLCKNGKNTVGIAMLCRTTDNQLCVWNSEDIAASYASKKAFDNWRVRKATSEDFALFGRVKSNRRNATRPCYKIMDEQKQMSKKSISSGALVEVFENYDARKFAISSKAEHEKEFLVEVAQVLSSTGSLDWNTRLKELLPLVVDMCCKYRGYKAETVFERRELVAGDLEMPKSA